MKTIHLIHGVLALAFFSTVGCSSEAPDEPSARTTADRGGSEAVPASALPSSVTNVARSVPGYRHEVSRSRFALGASVHTEIGDGWTRYVGSDGVFGVQPSGATIANMNSNAAALKVRFTGTEEDHGRIAREYFVAAGIPADQIGAVAVQTKWSSTRRVGDPVVTPDFDGYVSILRRRVEGIDVVGSVAAVEFNGSGDVVSESVYWPELPRSIVDQAKALSTEIAKEGRKASIFSKLHTKDEGRVVIEHTPSTEAKLEIRAAFDVVEGANVHHFAATGEELHFNSEMVRPAVAAAR